MKRFIFWLALLCVLGNARATGITDIAFGRYQIADSQWNVSACMYTATCQIYSTAPGTMYTIPWYNGQWNWQAGQYVKFSLTGDATNPYEAKVYNADGTLAGTVGTGHIINMGVDSAGHALFFFVGNDNNTGQLFSTNYGFSGTSGYTWTGTLNPTTAQVDSFATNYGSTTPLSPGQTYTSTPTAPTLCCGGSAAQFNADAGKVARVASFMSRTTADSQVYIEQIGNLNTITVEQAGSKNNSAAYIGNGSFNTVNILQVSQNSSQTNYTEIGVSGNNNEVGIKQRTTSGETASFTKGVFANIAGNNNGLIVDQRNTGNHYLEVDLTGGNKHVDVTQTGSATQMARIVLSGSPVDLSLTQGGSTQNFYSINFNCATAGGCAKISVTQGQ